MVQRDPGLGVLERVTAAGAPVQRAAVLGDPIEHSLSPVLHTAAYEALGLTGWHYDRRRVGAAELAGVVAELGQEWRGLSLTMPLKEAAFDVATEVSERARRARSINTLVRRADGGWAADNTDVIGIHRALGLGETELPRATVLGAGATARSAVVALAGTVSGSIRVAARDPRKASVALAELSRDLPIEVCPLEEWADDPGQAVVSTLPPGGPTPWRRASGRRRTPPPSSSTSSTPGGRRRWPGPRRPSGGGSSGAWRCSSTRRPRRSSS